MSSLGRFHWPFLWNSYFLWLHNHRSYAVGIALLGLCVASVCFCLIFNSDIQNVCTPTKRTSSTTLTHSHTHAVIRSIFSIPIIARGMRIPPRVTLHTHTLSHFAPASLLCDWQRNTFHFHSNILDLQSFFLCALPAFVQIKHKILTAGQYYFMYLCASNMEATKPHTIYACEKHFYRHDMDQREIYDENYKLPISKPSKMVLKHFFFSGAGFFSFWSRIEIVK